jgi:hypothetical protein
MRIFLRAILSVLLLAIGTSSAHADSVGLYTVTFTCRGVCLTVPTALDNVSFSPPSILQASVNGYVSSFTIPIAAGQSPTDKYNWSEVSFEDDINGVPNYFSSLIIRDETNGLISEQGRIFNLPQRLVFGGSGTLQFTPVAPEPSSFVLIPSGIGLLFAMRERILARQRYKRSPK